MMISEKVQVRAKIYLASLRDLRTEMTNVQATCFEEMCKPTGVRDLHLIIDPLVSISAKAIRAAELFATCPDLTGDDESIVQAHQMIHCISNSKIDELEVDEELRHEILDNLAFKTQLEKEMTEGFGKNGLKKMIVEDGLYDEFEGKFLKLMYPKSA